MCVTCPTTVKVVLDLEVQGMQQPRALAGQTEQCEQDEQAAFQINTLALKTANR